jgi:hypothetical protein
MSKPAVFTFVTMNNVDDPADLNRAKGECVALVNVDPDNDGGIAVRPGLVTGLIQQPVTESMGSRNYWAVGNKVYCSKALSDDEDQRFSTVITLDDMITMIRRVDGGLYVGSTTELHYLHGTDPQVEGFSDQWTESYGVILGTGCHVRGGLLPPGLGMSGNCCIFATHRGVMIGAPGGVVINLSQGKVSYDYGLTGKACIRETNGLVHYLFTTSATNPAYNRLPAFTFPVN